MAEPHTADEWTNLPKDAQQPTATEVGKRTKLATRSRRGIEKGTGQLERGIERGAAVMWRGLRKRPMLGVALVTGAGLLVAELVGVAEVAFAGAVGYGAYQMLKKKMPPAEAIRKAMELERDL